MISFACFKFFIKTSSFEFISMKNFTNGFEKSSLPEETKRKADDEGRTKITRLPIVTKLSCFFPNKIPIFSFANYVIFLLLRKSVK